MEKQENRDSIVFNHDVLELTTVAVKYCQFVEQANSGERNVFVETLLKLLPLLYLKGMLLTDLDTDENVELVDTVTEENYDIIRGNVAYVMGEKDDYLDVFVEDMKYSDTPVLMTISENVADIYQDLKNFCMAMRDGTDEVRIEAVAECKLNFKHYWGQKLVNVLRALHDVEYSSNNDEDEIHEY